MTALNLSFGLVAPRMEKQLEEFKLPSNITDHFQMLADSIVALAASKMITNVEKVRANHKLAKHIAGGLK